MLFLIFLTGIMSTQAKPRSGKILKGALHIYQKPEITYDKFGKIRGKGRFKIYEVGKKCKYGRWYKIKNGAWVCSGWFIPTDDPEGKEEDWINKIANANYYKNTSRNTYIAKKFSHINSKKMRRVYKQQGFYPVERFLLRGVPWYKLFDAGYVSARSITPYKFINLRGVKAKRKELPIVFVVRKDAWLWKRKRGKFVKFNKIDKYAVRPVKDPGGPFYKIKYAPHVYLKKSDTAYAPNPPAPPASIKKDEHWIDIDLGNNILYAFKGKRLIKLMLTSSAQRTETGIHRVYLKRVYQTYDQLRIKDGYFLEAVPYVQYYMLGFSIHGAYWHDDFPDHITHGCVNLSVIDSKWLFRFLGPIFPRGFVELRGSKKNPGGLVRLRRPPKQKTE
ncbi:MAG: L,D-transpeptidase [Deltaproteobacteria bacterium]|nr:L,D-transpeptidase [Deltaproteobacteria bacterium]